MGLFNIDPPAQFQRFDPPIGVHLNYCVPWETTLILRERLFSFSGDDFIINDSSGNPVCRCEGQALSFRDRKYIYAMDGQPLVQLKRELFTFLTEYVGKDQGNREVLRVSQKFSFGTKIEAGFVNAHDGQPVTIKLRGDIFGGSATLTTADGRPIAQIYRQYDMVDIFMGAQTYAVVVAPGVDLVTIAAICICFDEAKNDRRRR